MKKVSLLLVLSVFFSLSVAVSGQDETTKKAKKLGVQTKETSAILLPEQALQNLKDGNARFAAGKSKNQKKYRKQVSVTAKGQYPFAAIVSCIDSRISVDDVFDLNNGDAFNGRIAGNIVNNDMLGSLEFATKVSGAKVILVLGHSNCGAIKGACDDVKLGNLTGLLDKIEPAVEIIGKSWTDGEKDSHNPAFVEAVGLENVRNVIANIKKDSAIIKELVEKGEVVLVGGVYDLETGVVRFLK
jgi:carbonic anhydrase